MIKKKIVTTKTIGRSDKADFPEFNLNNINVKVDSGAYTSAIHCCKIDKNQNGAVEVIFLDEKDPKYTGTLHIFEDYSEKDVRSSNGVVEKRFIISTEIRLDRQSFDIFLSLTFRGDMRFPVLIGRKFLSRNRFIVNPRLKNHIHKKSLKK